MSDDVDVEALVEGSRQAVTELVNTATVAAAISDGVFQAFADVLTPNMMKEAIYNAVTDHLERHHLDVRR
jgi:hypothetical protein